MSLQRLWIPGQLPGLNQIIDDNKKTWTFKHGGRTFTKTAYDQVKKRWNLEIRHRTRQQGFRRIEEPAWFCFLFFEPNRRRDPDNIEAGGKKIILDGLQACKLLKNDGQNDVLGLPAYWEVRKHQVGALLYVAPGFLSKETILLLENERDEREERKRKAKEGPR